HALPPLLARLPLGGGLDDVSECRFGLLVDAGLVVPGDRVRHDHQRQIGNTLLLQRRLGKLFEGVGSDGNRRDALLFDPELVNDQP
ncbi:MAG TPA: hypothetical protein PLG21_16640, partial [Anaerolineae bacterium]|nr:hypothetical protein [Anaerolineae bacterium]